MSLKSVSIFLAVGLFSLFSMYSNEPKSMADVIKKDQTGFVSTNGDEPKFVYKYKGLALVCSRKQLEKYMSSLYWMPPIIFIEGLFAGCVFEDYFNSPKKTFLQENIARFSVGLLVVTRIFYLEMKKFQNQAGPWLQALKEKESENKLSLSKNA